MGKPPMENQMSSSMPKQEEAIINQICHLYGAVIPCYGNFNKQSMALAPKQLLLKIPPMILCPFL